MIFLLYIGILLPAKKSSLFPPITLSYTEYTKNNECNEYQSKSSVHVEYPLLLIMLVPIFIFLQVLFSRSYTARYQSFSFINFIESTVSKRSEGGSHTIFARTRLLLLLLLLPINSIDGNSTCSFASCAPGHYRMSLIAYGLSAGGSRGNGVGNVVLAQFVCKWNWFTR
jgi:hypothetical protein